MKATDNKLLFITGVGRSGTTLLQSMLNAHPEISLPPETHFFKKYVVPQLNGKQKLWDANELSNALKQDKYIERLGVNVDEIVNTNGLIDSESVSRLFINLLNAYNDKSYSFIGDKDTEYVRYLPHLHKAYPQAYLIHIIRDPRDVVLSRTKAEWGKKMPISFHISEYQYYIHKVLTDGKLFGKQYIEVVYEQLLENPERELKRVCEQLGVEFSSDMLNYHQQSESLVAKDEMSWKGNVFKPVMKDNSRKWHKEFTKSQIAQVEYGLKGILRKYGYEITNYGNSISGFFSSIPVKFASLAFAYKTRKEKV